MHLFWHPSRYHTIQVFPPEIRLASNLLLLQFDLAALKNKTAAVARAVDVALFDSVHKNVLPDNIHASCSRLHNISDVRERSKHCASQQ